MDVLGDNIAAVALAQFDSLPAKRQPQWRGEGVREWVPLSAIVVEGSDTLKCVALGTGMKCLPENKITQAEGNVLHDWHAEIVAIRSFNNFLLKECQALLASHRDRSDYIRKRRASEVTDGHFQPFTLNEDINLHMYCSEAPCGDASMELTMAAQEDDTPWSLPSDSIEADSHNQQTETVLRGRGYFSELGIVRRKPSRPDAPPTLSKSCSDKLALKQCTSLLSSPVSLLISPENAYLTSVTLPEAQYSATGCERAFSPTGRMAPVRDRRWKGGYRYQPFQFRTTSTEFSFSRRCSGPEKLVPSNISAVWTPYGEETLIGGVLQGRKQFDVRGASMISKRSMWKLALEVSALLAMPMISRALSCATYKEVKLSKLLEGRRKVKEDAKERALKGWVANWGNDFGLEAECLGHNSISQPP